MFEHLRIVALATAFLVALSAMQNASLASPKPQAAAMANFAVTPAESLQSAQARKSCPAPPSGPCRRAIDFPGKDFGALISALGAPPNREAGRHSWPSGLHSLMN